jgi:hypothetical protein
MHSTDRVENFVTSSARLRTRTHLPPCDTVAARRGRDAKIESMRYASYFKYDISKAPDMRMEEAKIAAHCGYL